MELIEENQVATEILNICFAIHKQYGPGLFEKVYEEIICYELLKKGFNIKKQYPVPLYMTT